MLKVEEPLPGVWIQAENVKEEEEEEGRGGGVGSGLTAMGCRCRTDEALVTLPEVVPKREDAKPFAGGPEQLLLAVEAAAAG